MTTTEHPVLSDADIDAIKVRQQSTWASGDYAVIGSSLQLVGEHLCEVVDIEAGWHVLDVAAGNGNASLAAARRAADVTATDIVPELLDRAAARAAADGLPLVTRLGDCEDLPFADRTFDAVVSVFGVMFAPRQEQTAAELVRVCKPGGVIGLANWTPDSFVAGIFETVARYVPPPPVPSVFRWGVEAEVAAMLGGSISSCVARDREFIFRYRSAEHLVDTFRTFYGPTHRAFAALGPDAQDALEHELVELVGRWNRSTSGAVAVPSRYLEFVITR